MESLYLLEPGRVEVREVAIPPYKEDEILVKIAYCGICTLEKRLYTGERVIHYPLVGGHEASGIVAEVGSEVVPKIEKGARVALDLVNRCYACPACLKGNSNLCENRYNAKGKILGAFSDYIVVKAQQVFVVPPALPLEEAAFSEPLACCIRSLKRSNLKLGDTVLISGAGTMGLLHLKVARLMGLRAFVSDIDPARLQRVGQGALPISQCEQTLKKVTFNRGVEAVIVTTPAIEAVELATKVIADNGVILIYTSYNGESPYAFDLNAIHRKEVTITGSEGRSGEDFYRAVTLLSHRSVQTDDLISHIYPLKKAPEAFEKALSGDSYRVLFKMGAL